MMRHLTDLYLVNSEKYLDDDVALIDEVFVRLVSTIEESSRALLAIRLAPLSNAPPKILRVLACDNAIDVASSILIHSKALDESTLIECARAKSQEHLLAISRRQTLGEPVTDVLIERGDQQVVLSTVQNTGAKFSQNGFAILVRRSKADDRLATCVGSRPDIPADLFIELLETASDFVRSKLEAENPRIKHDIDRTVTDVKERIRNQTNTQSPEFATAQVLVDSLNQSGQLNVVKLEAFAKGDRYEETVVTLALMSDLPTNVVEWNLKHKYAEFLLILAKAINLPWATIRIILTLGARKQLCSAGEIDPSLVDFRRLKRQTAQQILDFHRTHQNPRST